MSSKDAMRFPVVGSAVLFGLFLMFKFLPKELVNALLASYITLIGALVVVATLLPYVEPLFPPQQRERTFPFPPIPRIPLLMDAPLKWEPTLPELLLTVPALGLGAFYYATRSWLANNLLGLAFSIQGIEHLSLGSFRTGGILLAGLFVYDIFWVFCTPVMVAVAKNFEAPIKLLFPRGAPLPGGAPNFAMLGLGDIVIPGLFVALTLRYDVEMQFKTRYFQSVFWGYCVGLGTTIVVMNTFKAAQPALLYIVPAVLGALALHAAVRGELNALYNWQEEHMREGTTNNAGDTAVGAATSGNNGPSDADTSSGKKVL